MNQDKAVMALAALAQDTRLSVFRLLIKAGPDGMIAGALADAVAVPPSTMSHHLAKLEQAGLVLSWRTSRLIHYAADYAGVQALLTFLMADCCQGDPRACADLLSAIVCDRVGGNSEWNVAQYTVYVAGSYESTQNFMENPAQRRNDPAHRPEEIRHGT